MEGSNPTLDVGASFREVFRAATGQTPYPYQADMATGVDLPNLLRVPTGSGKTAAAVLGWLYRRRFHKDERLRERTPRRLVYCLPMRVLVEQTVDVIRDWLKRLNLTDQIVVYQLMGGVVQEDWVQRPARDAVLVGTMDMLLSRALNRGYAVGRSRWPVEFGLLHNDCLWVLDEVQLMGNGLATSAQLAAFREKLGTLRPCHSMWMSATAALEWLRTVDHHGSLSELHLTKEDLTGGLGERLHAPKTLRRMKVSRWPEEGPRHVLDLHRPGTLTLVVVNTVERARKIFDGLGRLTPAGVELRLLHSRFRPPDRRAAVKEVLAPTTGEGRIVVATQVVEAGIDLSAATLITELAPWGSLVQRFGRCNRFAEHADATVAWVDLRTEKEAAPYFWEELTEARKELETLEGRSVSPAVLESLGPGRPPQVRHVIRRMDLVDLFDTESDLAGNDVDVSRFIRDDADVDIHIYWRRWDGDHPPPDFRAPSPEELCPVPAWEVRQFLENRGRSRREADAYIWDHLERQWRTVASNDLRPGMTVLLAAEVGGYAPRVGWNRELRTPVDPLKQADGPAEPEDSIEDDPVEEVAGAWVPLVEHLRRVRDHVARLLDELGLVLEDWERQAVLSAALWHDVGKAHNVFQEALLQLATESERADRRNQVWAKAKSGRGHLVYGRRYFRHELASALALLASPMEVHGLQGAALDLAAYLVAAHHGKVRLAIRALPGERRPNDPGRRFARGVWDRDEIGPLRLDGITLPRLVLHLSPMEAGRGPDGQPSWAERALRLRDQLGPFRLGFLEALVRLSDWEASAEEREESDA